MNRLIIITAVRFLACKNQIQLGILEFGDLGQTVYANVGQRLAVIGSCAKCL